ncbi:MAG: ACT domain-containing protein [Candidatus Bilamarchaeaceae archaeon]
MKPLVIVADDKVGLLADISYILGKAKINIESINVDVVGGKAIISLTVSDRERAKSILEASSYKVNELEGLVLKLADKPGELSKITSMLSKEGVNITSVHMVSRDGTNTVISMTVDKPRKAEHILRDYLITTEEVF